MSKSKPQTICVQVEKSKPSFIHATVQVEKPKPSPPRTIRVQVEPVDPTILDIFAQAHGRPARTMQEVEKWAATYEGSRVLNAASKRTIHVSLSQPAALQSSLRKAAVQNRNEEAIERRRQEAMKQTLAMFAPPTVDNYISMNRTAGKRKVKEPIVNVAWAQLLDWQTRYGRMLKEFFEIEVTDDTFLVLKKAPKQKGKL